MKKKSLSCPQYPLLSGALISSVTGLLHNGIMTPNRQEYLSLTIAITITNYLLLNSKNSNRLNSYIFILLIIMNFYMKRICNADILDIKEDKMFPNEVSWKK